MTFDLFHGQRGGDLGADEPAADDNGGAAGPASSAQPQIVVQGPEIADAFQVAARGWGAGAARRRWPGQAFGSG